ncbi:Nephrocystin-3 [Actinoplanes sp. SE50]|uniref:tetratricopeptide repeat protein n=1 Tax=unclassified Actinoplanes TaxID=2626549 RepID=UPI00023EBBC5|nr:MULTISPECIES: tetratricopeptide repeat protein [unclassified Actinoplanes]AEV85674.1 Nephrocystin-3 [Actinoplanes sp. SE50/110]ATO84067.1 Nephrocystin-3 [Actinoplanes sp. SE50]SLM01477.1 hypothetical protein ACSP50_4713 [Actinoplanes sp. SE50/110]
MDADGSRPEVRRARPVERVALPPGPIRDLREMLYRLYAEADCPRIDRLAEAILADDALPGSPRKDLIIKIISGDGLASQQDTVTVAVTLAREAGRDDTAPVAEQVRQLWITARTAPARSDDSVVRVGRVPRPAAWFQDRYAHHALLRAARAGRSVVLTQVLSGLGGVGKTQLAAQFARSLDAAGELDVLAWITAANRQALVAGYADTAHALRLCGPETEPTAAADRLLSWLEHTSRRCLIVLDNLDSPADATGLWPPDNPRGRTLVTTRRRDAILHTDNRTMVPVGLFTPPEAADYLTQATGTTEPRSAVDSLAADLGLLPLALAQAAAYIRDHGIDCATYRQRLREHGLTARLLPPDDGLPDDHRTIVAAIWDVSITAADNHRPRGLARPLLEVAALLDPNGIPDALFTTTAITAHLGRAGITAPDPPAIIDGLHNLHRLHLITHDVDTHAVGIHALVQHATRDRCTPARLAPLARAAADALLEIWPGVDRDPVHTQTLHANTTALRTATGDALFTPQVHRLLFQAARRLGNTGQVAAAVIAAEQLLTSCLRILGPDHPDTLASRHNLAWWRGEAGDRAGAATAYEQLLTDQLRILGPDHPGTLATRHNLAWRRGEAGDPHAAERLLADPSPVLGAPTAAGPRSLAWRRGEGGDPVGAVTAYEQLLADRLRVLGPDHPDTLITRHGLAWWRGEAGDPAGAVTAYEELLSDRLRVLGPDHLDTLATRHNLAQWRGEAGDPVGAAAATEHLLTDQLRVVGPDHPHALASRYNLAQWRGESGDPAGAVTAYEQLLADQLRVLGPDHPDTLITRYHLAHWRGEAGDPIGAAAATEHLLADQLRVLGPDHPHTLATRHRLARWRDRRPD